MEQFVHILFTHAFVVLASSVQCFTQISLGEMQKRTQLLAIIGDTIIPVVPYQLLIQLFYQFLHGQVVISIQPFLRGF